MATVRVFEQPGPDSFSKQYLVNLDKHFTVSDSEYEAFKSDLIMSAQQQGIRLSSEISFATEMTDKTHMIITCFAKISHE